MTAPATPWLVTSSLGATEFCSTLEAAVHHMREVAQLEPVLWRRAPFTVSFDTDAAALSPPKRARRKRKDSAGSAEAAATPAASVPEKAAGVAEVRTTGHKAIWCGGRACTDRAGVEVHRDDPSCLKLHPPKRAEAVR